MASIQQDAQLTFQFDFGQCRISNKITPRLIDKVRKIEFEHYFTAGQEYIKTLNADKVVRYGNTKLNQANKGEVEVDNFEIRDIDTIRIFENKENAWTQYIQLENLTNEYCYKLCPYSFIVPILQEVLITDNLTEDQKALLSQPYDSEDADNFWYNIESNKLKKFYVDFKKKLS